MTASDRTQFEVLLENLQRDVKVIAEGHGVLAERLDHFKSRFDRIEGQFEHLAIQVAVLETRVHALETQVGAFSVDTQSRLERIETHLGFEGPSRSRTRRRRGSLKRRRPS
jgi:hypothetical protein